MTRHIFLIRTTNFIIRTDKISPLPEVPDCILLISTTSLSSRFPIQCFLSPPCPCHQDSPNGTVRVSQDTQFCPRGAASLQLAGWGFSSRRMKQGLQLHLRHRATTPHTRGAATLCNCVCVQTCIHFVQRSETIRQKRHRSLAETHTTVILASV